MPDNTDPQDKTPSPLTSAQQEIWRDHLAQLRTNHAESAVLHDKLIVTLAGGAIGISLTLLDNIAAAVSKAAVWQLVAAWVFLGLSLFIVLISHWLSIEAHRKAIEHTQEKLAGQNISTPAPDLSDRGTGIANIAAISTLGIGLIFLGLFFTLCLYRVAPTTHHVQFISDPSKYPGIAE